MSITNPFAYNTGSTISGTEQFGNYADQQNRITLYVNGEIVSNITTALTGFDPLDYTYVGSHVTESGSGGTPISFFDGRIGEVQYYNFPLDGRTMLFNYNITKSRYGY